MKKKCSKNRNVYCEFSNFEHAWMEFAYSYVYANLHFIDSRLDLSSQSSHLQFDLNHFQGCSVILHASVSRNL